MKLFFNENLYVSSIVHGGTSAYHKWGTGAFSIFCAQLGILLMSAFLDPVWTGFGRFRTVLIYLVYIYTFFIGQIRIQGNFYIFG